MSEKDDRGDGDGTGGAGTFGPVGPVLALCGWSGAGKTTLLEAALPRLVARGLAVAVVKHDAHGLSLDRPGKDSDRLYRAGADVFLGGPDERVVRGHGAAALAGVVARALEDHDVVLVEGHKGTALPKLWLCAEGETGPPPGVGNVLRVLPRDAGRREMFEAFLDAWLPRAFAAVPVLGAVLHGGRSRRIGCRTANRDNREGAPKHLVRSSGATFAERVHGAVAAHAACVVFLGSGTLPAALEAAAVPRLPDPPGAPEGPLAGLLGALRWAPGHALLAVACDQPRFTAEAAARLLAQRAPGTWAILPRRAGGPVEPLGAVYEPQARGLLEALAAAGGRAPRLLEGHPKVRHPLVPDALAAAWTSVDTPDDLARLDDGDAG